MPEAMLTPAEVAAYLQIPLATFYTWRTKGQGPPASRVGRHLRISRSDLDTWLEEQKDDAKAG